MNSTYDSTIDERENTAMIFAKVIRVHSKTIPISRCSSLMMLGQMFWVRVRIDIVTSMSLLLLNGTDYVSEFRIKESGLKNGFKL